MYVIRYHADVEMKDRKHRRTLGSWRTWLEAEEARLGTDRPDLLTVEGPR